jgi:hypothetical protein
MEKRIVKITYFVSVLILTLSGFGQMPVFKRYYIADIPGFAWLAQFYVTHFLHYLSAIVLIALSGYLFTIYFFSEKRLKLTLSGYLKSTILAGLIVTGILMVLKNFEGYLFSPGIVSILDVTHLGLVMILLLTSLATLLFKKKWTKNNIEE